MRAVIQRVTKSSVTVDHTVIAEINRGLLVLLGVARDDTHEDADYLTDKISNLRIFEDNDQKMNKSLIDIKGEMLIVSQFTLLANCKKGRRPSFIEAAPPDKAKELYEYFTWKISEKNIKVKMGEFQAMMDVMLINHGPVTLIVESR